MLDYFSVRLTFFWILLLCIIAMSVALYFQFVENMQACVLCIIQRVAVISVGVVALIAWLHNPKAVGIKVYAGLIVMFCLFGLWFAGRQIWLQHLPADQVPACGPGLNYLVQILPPKDVLVLLFKGTGDCAEIHWQFLGLSIASWSLVMFVIITSLSLWQLFRKTGSKKL